MLLVRGNTMFTKSLTVVLSLLILTSASTTYADDIPNNELIGLAQTPIQAPLLQHDNKIDVADVSPPVKVVNIDFLFFINIT